MILDTKSVFSNGKERAIQEREGKNEREKEEKDKCDSRDRGGKSRSSLSCQVSSVLVGRASAGGWGWLPSSPLHTQSGRRSTEWGRV